MQVLTNKVPPQNQNKTALLQALPKMFKVAMLKKIRVVQHGDTLDLVKSRGTLWHEVLKLCQYLTI